MFMENATQFVFREKFNAYQMNQFKSEACITSQIKPETFVDAMHFVIKEEEWW